MCKLFSITNATRLNQKQLTRLTASISRRFAKTERDGFGLSVKTRSGVIVESRWINPIDARWNYAPSPVSIVFHGRTSTNDVSLTNTHPIRRSGLSVCHNGVVEDLNQDYETITTTDSELLTERLSRGLDSVESNIVGYYAALYHNENDFKLRLIKDNIASLFIAYSQALKGFVIATRADHIEDIMRENNLQHDEIFSVNDNVYLEFYLGHVLTTKEIRPKGRSRYADSLSSLSLGHDLTALNEEMFFVEIDNLSDHSWVFFKGHKELSLDQFFDLDDTEKLSCLVVRSDGTICSSDTRLNGQVFDYAMLRCA